MSPSVAGIVDLLLRGRPEPRRPRFDLDAGDAFVATDLPYAHELATVRAELRGVRQLVRLYDLTSAKVWLVQDVR